MTRLALLGLGAPEVGSWERRAGWAGESLRGRWRMERDCESYTAATSSARNPLPTPVRTPSRTVPRQNCQAEAERTDDRRGGCGGRCGPLPGDWLRRAVGESLTRARRVFGVLVFYGHIFRCCNIALMRHPPSAEEAFQASATSPRPFALP